MNFKYPESIEDVNSMISNKVMESIHLDYKAGKALNGKIQEISKDISAFANSDGGCIIYGVTEEGHLPIALDEGTDHSAMTRERLEQIIQSNVSPVIDNLIIMQIPLNDSHSLFVLATPQSHRAPHQDRQSLRYYKRNNFQSIPMENYEILDIRNRQYYYPSLIHVDIDVERGVFLEFSIENIGNVTATDLKIMFSKPLNWEKCELPQFKEGIKSLPPKKKLSFFYSTVLEAFKKDSNVEKAFTVEASYFHPFAGKRLTEKFHIDINSIESSSSIYSDIYHHGKRLEENYKKIFSQLKEINQRIEALESIAGPTGLNVSVTTIRNIASLFGKKFKPEPIDPMYCSNYVFQEILGVDLKLASRIETYFQWREWEKSKKSIEEIEGVDTDLAKRIREYFIIAES